MGSDHLQPGEKIQNSSQLDGVGIVIPVVAHVQQHRQLSLYRLIHGEKPQIVNGKSLGIRVHFDALQSQLQDPLHLVIHMLHGSVDCTEADERIVLLYALDDKIVDALHSVSPDGNGQNHKF